MEVSGTLLRRVPYISAGAGTCDARDWSSSSFTKPSSVSMGGGRAFKARQRKLSVGSGFCDNGHVEYYRTLKIRCDGSNKVDKKKTVASISTKKKLKLLKNLTESLSMVSDLSIALDSESTAFLDQLRGQINLDTSEVLLKRLEQLKAQEEELRRQKKQEKAKLKASKMKTKHGCESSSSSSSSESSDDEYDEVVDMNFARQGSVSVAAESTTLNETRPDAQGSTVLALPSSPALEEKTTQGIHFEDHSRHEVGSCSRMTGIGSLQNVSSKTIEVCMGNKCKKSGSAALLEEFVRAMGDEGSVVGCKCMGKCRNGPNVRILNSIDNSFAEGANDSVRTPANSLCIGVGVEDVNALLSNYFGKEQKDLGELEV